VGNTSRELFCSDACASAVLARSFGVCPDCGKQWDGRGGTSNHHYRNTLWKICNTCSREQKRCARCGLAIDRSGK